MVDPNHPIGYCDQCKKPLYEGDTYEIQYRKYGSELQCLICTACDQKQKKQQQTQELLERRRQMKIRLWLGSLLSAAVLIAGTVLSFTEPLRNTPGTFPSALLSILAAYLTFAFVFQLGSDDTDIVTDIFSAGFKSFRMPGVIFSLDWDGIFRLIVIKLLFACLSVLLSFLCFLLMFSLSFLVSGVTFPFVLAKSISAIRSLHTASK